MNSFCFIQIFSLVVSMFLKNLLNVLFISTLLSYIHQMTAGACMSLRLNTNAVSSKNCGDVINGFPSLLLVSVVFCAVSGFFLFALAISGTCTVYYRKHPHDGGLIPTHPSLHDDVTAHRTASHALPVDLLDESYLRSPVRAPEDPGVPVAMHVLAVQRTVESMSPVRYRSL